jgi:hypothetical protein
MSRSEPLKCGQKLCETPFRHLMFWILKKTGGVVLACLLLIHATVHSAWKVREIFSDFFFGLELF